MNEDKTHDNLDETQSWTRPTAFGGDAVGYRFSRAHYLLYSRNGGWVQGLWHIDGDDTGDGTVAANSDAMDT